MTSKEAMYVEDALGHAQFLQTQCQDAMNALKDQTLKSHAQQWKDKNCQTFRQFYALV